MAKAKVPSTQDFIALNNIDEDIVLLKDGGLRQIVIVSGLNLDLQSEDEKNSVINLYQHFLNSLDFPVQILIHSRKFNIGNYLKNLEERERLEINELLKNQIFEYKQFIKTFVEQNDIMNKMFLVVIPFNPIRLLPKKNWFNFRRSAAPASTDLNDQEKNINYRQLRQRTEQVIDGLQSIGLRAVALNNEELTELFYNFYNPETVEKENLNLPGASSASSLKDSV